MSFDRLVSLACHDLRTPLATVHGFARTLPRLVDVEEQGARYLDMMALASEQMGELLEELGLAARIEGGRYDPALVAVELRALVDAAVAPLEGQAAVDGDGAAVLVDPEAAERAVRGLVRCALRHGGLERIELRVAGPELTVTPVVPAAAAIVVGEDLRDLGAAVAVRAIAATGGSLELDGEALVVRLPVA